MFQIGTQHDHGWEPGHISMEVSIVSIRIFLERYYWLLRSSQKVWYEGCSSKSIIIWVWVRLRIHGRKPRVTFDATTCHRYGETGGSVAGLMLPDHELALCLLLILPLAWTLLIASIKRLQSRSSRTNVERSRGRVLEREPRNSGSEPQDMQKRKDRDKTEVS